MNAGLVFVTDALLHFFEGTLPPGHRVLSVRPGEAYHEVIVEGPMLPEWSDQSIDPPETVTVLYHEDKDPNSDARVVTGEWRRVGQTETLGEMWFVGKWPDGHALQQAMWRP